MYHKKGIDISFGGEVSRAYYSGDTGRKIENTRLGISINVASTTNEGDIFEAICHELFIHSRQAAYDYIDDHKLNHSYLNKYLKEYVKQSTNKNSAYVHAEHAQFAWYDNSSKNDYINVLSSYFSTLSNSDLKRMIEKGLQKITLK